MRRSFKPEVKKLYLFLLISERTLIKIIIMEEKSKVFVFDKMEVALVLVFTVVVASLSFVFGVKVGKSFSYQEAGLGKQERELVDYKSVQEEEAQAIFDKMEKEPIKKEEVSDVSMDELKKEFEHLDAGTLAPQPKQETKVVTIKEDMNRLDSDSASATEKLPEGVQEGKKADFVGKYTIQLGSYRTLEEAQSFAEGFAARGYNPIINEVDLQGRGVWFRVGLGSFQSVAAAKDYIQNESSLFNGQEYVITEFK